MTSWRSSSSGVLSHFFSWITSKLPPFFGLAGSKTSGKNSTHSLKTFDDAEALVIHRALDHLDHVIDVARRACAR